MSKVLYPLAAGPRPTQLVSPYTPGDDSIILVDVSYLPPAPNLITISHDENFITLKYETIVDENTISGITYIEGDNTYVFPEMSLALRTINKYDFDAIRENIVADVSEVIGHIDDYDNPHRVSKTQVGLGDVDNTSDVDKPISSATQTALNNINNSLDSHVDNKSNPHAVTKSQVGLSNVDNTSDLSKPISTATQNALNNKADLVGGKVPIDQLPESSSLQLGTGPDDAYYGDKGNVAYIHSQTTSGNPHHVTKSDVGLGDVDNTSDLDKPISSATQAALNGKADLVNGKVPSNQLPESNTLELGITATTAYYGDKGKIAYDHSQLRSGNPHDVTKSDVGLSNVDNTSDADKPISTAVQTALSTKADLVNGKVPSSQLPETAGLELGTTATTAYYGDKGKVAYDHSQLVSGNPHHVNKSDVGLGNVDNTSDINKPVSTAQQTAIGGVQDNLDNHIDDTSNPHQVTKSQVGLSNVDNTSDADKPVSTLQKAAIDAVQGNLDTHEADTSNPHSVTKTQVGLGNADNTSDADKPISTATQTALNGKADLVEGKVPSSQLPDNIGLELGITATTAYYGDKGKIAYDHSQLTSGNPHNVTKSEVGLGNVDNTSDSNKPVSTLQAEAIGLVQTNITTHENDKSNPHEVDKSQVGLGNVDNTSDLSKPISTAVQAALDTKMTGTYSSTTPNSPTINGLSGSLETVSRGDHAHPSETFTLTGLSVPTSSWVSDNTYGIYTWRASIINSAITANHTPIVMFSQVDSSLGIFSQVAETASGVVYIYASEIPESTTTINSIVFIKDI